MGPSQGEAPGRGRGVLRGSRERRGACSPAGGLWKVGACALSEAGLLVSEETISCSPHADGHPGCGQRFPALGPWRRVAVSRDPGVCSEGCLCGRG